MKKGIQYFTKEYLKECSKLTPDQILEFLENYRQLFAESLSEKCILISLKIEPSLLKAFKQKVLLEGGLRYQTKIKQLMREWVLEP